MKKLCVVVALLVVFALPAAACWLPPEPFTVQGQDRVFTFEPADWEIDATASVSLHDENGNEIWRIDDFSALAFEGSFVFSYDMNEFAFFVANTHEYALKIYADGQLQFVYRVDDFIEIDHDAPLLSIGHQWLETREFDPDTNLLTLTTTQGDVRVIDLSQRAQADVYHYLCGLALLWQAEMARQAHVHNVRNGVMIGAAAVVSVAAILVAVVALQKKQKLTEEFYPSERLSR